MTRINRRECLTMVGVGLLTAKLGQSACAQAGQNNAEEPQQANAAHTVAAPALMQTAHNTAVIAGSLDETYFWRDKHTVLFVRRAPQQTVFRAVFVDALTGKKTLPQAFNAKNSRLMESKRMLLMAGSPQGEMHYLPPTAALSPDGKWLLWSHVALPRIQWVAATFEGQQQKWKQDSDPARPEANLPTSALWMPDSKRWVALVSRYQHAEYSIHLAQEYHVGISTPVRSVNISGMPDGLPVGIRQDEAVVMHIPSPETDAPVRQINLSLVSLGAETATARKLCVPVPACVAAADVTLSPQGDRLAWILVQEHGETQLYTLYTVDADGARARPMGSAPGVQVGEEYSWPRDLRWLPDGKQMSFVYKNALYTLPVS